MSESSEPEVFNPAIPGASRNTGNEPQRISLESLKRYAPMYQKGLEAKSILDKKYSSSGSNEYVFSNNDEEEYLSLRANGWDANNISQEVVEEVSALEAAYYRGEFALEKLVEQATPLLHSEVFKIASKAAAHEPEEIHSVLFYEAINGLKKGLAKYDPEKNMKSVTNYLFQWATTYAKRELNKIEAPFGVPPSRYEKYKKVAAVRSKLTEELGRYATNEEVLEYFHSGAADIKTYNGPVALKDQGSRANKEVDLKLVEDQEYFEKNLAYTKYLNDDTGEFYPDNVLSTQSEFISGERSIFKDFIETQKFSSDTAIAILNETQSSVEQEIIDKVHQIPEKRYKQIVKEFRALVRDNGGEFHRFVKEKITSNDIEGYDVDLRRLLKDIETVPETKHKRRYRNLYENSVEDKNE